jgi:ADP-ribosyl-[dinitrogen reductase] hydrolase
LVGSKGDRSAGNGPATRIAPLAFLLDPADAMARQTIRDVCRITHHNDEAYAGALAVLTGVRLAFTDAWLGDVGLVYEVASVLPDSAVRDRLVEMSRDCAAPRLSELASRYGTSGYVVESVPFALAAAERLRELGFRTVLEEAIRAGGDTDSIASIVGQVCGACIGRQALPRDWIALLPEVEQVMTTADLFCRYVSTLRQ